MGLRTRSAFYYGQQIDKTQHFISIDEGSGELSVNLTPSGYSFTELGTELQRALNAAGINTYTVTTNRSTRKYTIVSTGVFSILSGTGLYFGSSAYIAIGFNGADHTGFATYTSTYSTGSVWLPQLPLFNYTPSAHREGSLQATQDESGGGTIEVVSFGTVNYMDFDVRFITNRADKPDVVERNLSAVEDTMSFLSYIRQKNRFEFMEDRDDVSNFEKFILVKSSSSPNGLDAQLFEMIGQNLQDYYETRSLTFRKVL